MHDDQCEAGHIPYSIRSSAVCGCQQRAVPAEDAEPAIRRLIEGLLRDVLTYFDSTMSLGRVADVVTEVTGQNVIICSPAVATLLNRFAVEPTVDDLTALAMALTGKEITSMVIGWADE